VKTLALALFVLIGLCTNSSAVDYTVLDATGVDIADFRSSGQSSAVVDAGADLGTEYYLDFDGYYRESGWDAGAFEFAADDVYGVLLGTVLLGDPR